MAKRILNTVEFNEHAYALDKGLMELHLDLEVLAWAADELFHSKIDSSNCDDEKLSRFPVAVLRMLAGRTGPLVEHWDQLESIK